MEASIDRTSRRYKIADISGPTSNQKEAIINRAKTKEELISVLEKSVGAIQGSEKTYTPPQLKKYIDRAFKVYDLIYQYQKPDPKNITENQYMKRVLNEIPRTFKLRSKVAELIISEHKQRFKSRKKN